MIRVRYAAADEGGESTDDLFDRLLALAAWPRNSLRQSWRPAVDVLEVESGLMIIVELPGVHESDLSVTVQHDRLRISGVRRMPNIEQCKGPLQLEIDYGPFDRSVALPRDIDPDKIEAHFRHGLLALYVPRPNTGRTIRVRSADEGET